MQLAVRSLHLTFQGGIDRALLLNAVLATETFINHFSGVMVSITRQIRNSHFCVWKCDTDQIFYLFGFDRHGCVPSIYLDNIRAVNGRLQV